MLNSRDLHIYHHVVPLTVVDDPPEAGSAAGTASPATTSLADSPPGNRVGTFEVTYEIRRYNDLRNLRGAVAYYVVCTQRITIPNSTYSHPDQPWVPHTDSGGYQDYPAIVTSRVHIKGPQDSQAESPTVPYPEIVSYSPRTLNSSVSVSRSSSDSATSSATMQNTSGSSTSQSNSFTASASLGTQGADVSASYGHTAGSDRSRSASVGSESGTDDQHNAGDSMSVKDWACASYRVDGESGPTLVWVWGQEYPWNVLQYNDISGGLPQFVQQLLRDGDQALPPSQLSQFGIDFAMKSAWILGPGQTTATFAHEIGYRTASHSLADTTQTPAIDAGPTPAPNPVVASISPANKTTYSSPPLDLCQYALDPILSTDAAPVAIVGFIPRQFLIAPVPASGGTPPTPFTIVSSANNLLIQDSTDYPKPAAPPTDTGAGFAASETALRATLTRDCPELRMTTYFKILDTDTAYQLLLKHWKAPGAGVSLTIVINGDDATKIVLYIDAQEAEGGEGNVSSLLLRDLRYGSVDYHDYLSLGLNQIDITIAPINPDGTKDCTYMMRAISIEQE